MENMDRVFFYCVKCDGVPVMDYVDKDNFYRCKECKTKLHAIQKDSYEE